MMLAKMTNLILLLNTTQGQMDGMSTEEHSTHATQELLSIYIHYLDTAHDPNPIYVLIWYLIVL